MCAQVEACACTYNNTSIENPQISLLGFVTTLRRSSYINFDVQLYYITYLSASELCIVFLQKLETDSEDSYLNAEWADPERLKRQITGTGSISWRPK